MLVYPIHYYGGGGHLDYLIFSDMYVFPQMVRESTHSYSARLLFPRVDSDHARSDITSELSRFGAAGVLAGGASCRRRPEEGREDV